MQTTDVNRAVCPVPGMALPGASPEDRRALLSNGYEPIPVCGKRPRWSWRDGPITDAVLTEVEDDPRYADHLNTGVKTGGLSVVDIDVSDQREVEVVQQTVFDVLGDSDMLRVGSKGVAICYYNPVPCPKITVVGRRHPANELRPLVEFLGDGQQMVAYGLHPDTMQPYEWLRAYDDAEPLFRPLEELPRVSTEKLKDAAKAVASMLASLGYVDVAVRGLAEAAQEASGRAGEPVPAEWLKAALAAIPPSCPRDEWLRVIFAVKSAVVIPSLDDDARIELLDLWSSAALGGVEAPESYRGWEDVRRTYESAQSGRQRAVGVGTLLRIAEAHGYSGGAPRVSLFEIAGTASEDAGTPSDEANTAEVNRWANILRPGEDLRSMPPARFFVPEWLRDVGVHILLAERGTGKTVVAVDLALSLATGRRWMDEEVVKGCYCVYLCGEDKENTAGHILAWCDRENGGRIPDRFIFAEDTPDLTSKADCDMLVKQLQTLIPEGRRVVLFLDTWQRATSKAKDGQNSDRDMAEAMELLEGLGRALNGPVVGCFHPPKADRTTTHGSAITENASTAIWHLTRPETDSGVDDLELRVTRIKGPGLGNHKLLRLEKTVLDRRDESGRPLTGAVVMQVGGTISSLMDRHEREQREEAAVLAMVRSFARTGILIVRGNGSGQKPKDVAKAVKTQYGLNLYPKRVLEILNKAERDGLVRYVAADKNQRVQAGFRLASEMAAESDAKS